MLSSTLRTIFTIFPRSLMLVRNNKKSQINFKKNDIYGFFEHSS